FWSRLARATKHSDAKLNLCLRMNIKRKVSLRRRRSRLQQESWPANTRRFVPATDSTNTGSSRCSEQVEWVKSILPKTPACDAMLLSSFCRRFSPKTKHICNGLK